MEITRFNLNEHIERVEKSIDSAIFIGIDMEFTGLLSNQIYRNSLFDTSGERYTKLRKGTDGIIASQVGISAFRFNRDQNSYKSDTYTFHLCPQSVGAIDQTCTFQASALSFLTNNDFDFNKFAFKGLPYLNRHEENLLKQNINEGSLDSYLGLEDSQEVDMRCTQISQWIQTAAKHDTFTISGNPMFCYLMTERIRQSYPNLSVTNNEVEIVIENMDEKVILDVSFTKEEGEKILKYALGFSRVIKAIEKAKKPVVFHNALTDLVVLYNQFFEPLPTRYESFKNNVNEIFPQVFDTKYISNEMKFAIKKEDFSESTSLEKLYTYFKDEKGRHLALHSPLITMNDQFDPTPRFHQAGWDAYSTGYCFIRLCHWAACLHSGGTRVATSTEHLAAVAQYCNCVHLARAAQTHLCLNSNDPASHRPPFLHIEALTSKNLNMSQVINAISQYGNMDIQKCGSKSALVAVANPICARKILKDFSKNSDIRVSRYNVFKHSPVARITLWSGLVVASGSLIALILHKIIH